MSSTAKAVSSTHQLDLLSPHTETPEGVVRQRPTRRTVTVGLSKANQLAKGQLGLDSMVEGVTTRRHLPVYYHQCFAHRAVCTHCDGAREIDGLVCDHCSGTGREFARYNTADELEWDETRAEEMGVVSQEGLQAAGMRLAPCLYVSCRSHIAVEINATGNPQIHEQWMDPDDRTITGLTCVLDVVQPMSLEEVGDALGLSRQAVLGNEMIALAKVRTRSPQLEDFLPWDPSDPPVERSRARSVVVNDAEEDEYEESQQEDEP